MRKIMLDAAGMPVLNSSAAAFDFLLNFKSDEGVLDTRFETASAGPGSKPTDGDDRIFGDLGNDWIVGGTGRDHMYGGRGDDLINADDDHNTLALPPKKGLGGDLENNQADSFMAYTDIVYGGAGRDVMIHNTGGDRLIDWTGEFNSYIVPYSPFGAPEVVRDVSPQIERFLLDLSRADGADQRLPDAQLSVDQRLTVGAPAPDPARNFEPYGELGMVRQPDPDFGDQHGPPQDPQAGNSPGNQRDFRPHLADPVPTTPELASALSGTRFVAEPLAAITASVPGLASALNGTAYAAEPLAAMAASASMPSFALFDPVSGLGATSVNPESSDGAPASSVPATIDWSTDFLVAPQQATKRSGTGWSDTSGLQMPDFLFAPLAPSRSPLP